MFKTDPPAGEPPVERFDPRFPSGKDLEILIKARTALYEAAQEAGFETTGCGVGVGAENSDGEADIGLKIDGRCVEVRIFLPRDTN